MNIRLKTGLLRIRDLLQAAPVTRRTVRFYEQRGLLHPVGREPGGRRVYAYGDALRLRLIHELRSAGLSLESIQQVLDLRGVQVVDRLLIVLERHGERLRAQILTMSHAEQGLREAVAWIRQHRHELDDEPERFVGDPDVPLLARALLALPGPAPVQVKLARRPGVLML